MQIVTVEYRRLRTFGSYQNETVGAVVEVTPGVPPESVLEELKTWVNERLGDDVERANLREAINELEWRHGNLVAQIADAEKRWAAIQEFLKQIGIERPAHIPGTLEELPF